MECTSSEAPTGRYQARSFCDRANFHGNGMYYDRPMVFAGGINNLRRAATFLALDPDKFAGGDATASVAIPGK
jgi:hypothetical protein